LARRLALAVLACSLLAGTASLAQSSSQTNAGVAVLSGSDARLYRDIMRDERTGAFADADQDFDRLSDPSLKGYVLAEHYLSPRAKHVHVKDLVAWLESYNDLPIAERVYRLAVKKSTKKVRHHHHTTLVAIVTNIPVPSATPHRRGGGYEDGDLPDPPFTSAQTRAAQPQIEQFVRTDQPDQAHAVLNNLIAQYAPALDVARLSHRIASSYLAEGMDQQAYDLATSVGGSEARSVPLLSWVAGLAAYRLGKYDDAAQRFETLAEMPGLPRWTRSGAAFWAARAHLQAGDPAKVVTYLQLAAKSEPTFYGLISERILGQDTISGFSEPSVNEDDFSRLMQNSAAHRAVALLQIGDREDAIPELNRAFAEIDPQLDPTFAAVARKFDAPNLELRASETASTHGVMLTGLFPVPQYQPDGGYRIDPSLVLAFARLESRFQPDATSPAGARGLMQLMPGTATHIGGPGAAERLGDASYNLALGQRYIEELLSQMNGNLIELAASYNAGPGALTRWLGTKGGMMDDPLLFIESMPVPETRNYVKRMMTYHWMYQRRMGRGAKSLDETATGGWPNYHPSGSVPTQIIPPPQTPLPNTQISDARPY
jgi:soluble lytic murein transglycosylase